MKEKIASDVGNPLVQDGRKLIPSVTRTFRADQTLTVFLQSYERNAASMRPLVAFVAFYRDGVKAFETEPLGVSDGWDRSSNAVPIRVKLSLDSLATGAYECQVTVLDPENGRAAFWRAPVVITSASTTSSIR